MKRRSILGLALGAACAGVRAAPAPATPPARLRIVTAHLPPLVMAPGGAKPGALNELVGAVCARLGVTPELAFVPWRRALYLATTMPRTAIFPVTRLPERESAFRWLAPLYEEHYSFMAAQASSFDVQHPEKMTGQRIALLRGAAQSAILRELGFRQLVEASSIDEVHRFLLAGMADAVFGERAIIHASLVARGAEQDFSLGPPVRSTSAWLAASLDFSDAEAGRYGEAMAALVADGSQAKILKRYGLA